MDKGSCAGHESVLWVLGVDPGLEGPAVDLEVVLGHGKLLASRGLQLPLDQIGTGDHLGNGVLNLKKSRKLINQQIGKLDTDIISELTCNLVFISMKKKLKSLSMMNSTVPAPT